MLKKTTVAAVAALFCTAMLVIASAQSAPLVHITAGNVDIIALNDNSLDDVIDLYPADKVTVMLECQTAAGCEGALNLATPVANDPAYSWLKIVILDVSGDPNKADRSGWKPNIIIADHCGGDGGTAPVTSTQLVEMAQRYRENFHQLTCD